MFNNDETQMIYPYFKVALSFSINNFHKTIF